MKKDYLKIILGGDGGVGKTTLMLKLLTGHFFPDTEMTTGVQFFVKDVKVAKDNVVALQFWDFGGEERFRGFLDSYVPGVKGALLMYDLSRKIPTISKVDEWIEIIRKENPSIPIVFLGTKSDKILTEPTPYELINRIIKKHNLSYYLSTSSLTGKNVNESVSILVNMITSTFKSLEDYNKRKKKLDVMFFSCPECDNGRIIDKELLIYCPLCDLHFEKSDFGIVNKEGIMAIEDKEVILQAYKEFLPLSNFENMMNKKKIL